MNRTPRRILLVTATAFEAESLRKLGGILHPQGGMWINAGQEIHLIHTGLGMVNTAFALGRALDRIAPELVVNYGIAGAFAGGPEIGAVVEVVEDCYAELGAESPGGFLTLAEMGFRNFEAGGVTYHNVMRNPQGGSRALRACKGITVNKVHGVASSIAEAERQWAPEVETMEGAAVFQACLMAGIPFRCYRGISNRVEPRNRDAWRIPEAIAAVEAHVLQEYFPASM